jgi:hypothetical protein
MTTKMTKEEQAQSSAHRYRNAFGWFTIEETMVIKRSLETYIALGPDTSWPIKLARDLLKNVP